ncbi:MULTISPECIES: VanW family protein [Paenibacillus]|uniref:VanW family protein n=2 Tax=Paenibacillus TaxID=44249 RepID=A0ABY8XA49_9BACL|nr:MULTISPECIES: VanW family protein [Paenibacillus]MBD7966756.1 VanW family protein [Paenibacillus gallinarum]WIV20351.1 VanW family protein [Paenibacillus polygoni]
MKPIKRSKLRIKLGTAYYRSRRYVEWYFGGTRFAQKQSSTVLPYKVASHKTPLLRKLKDVDMWLQHNKIINLKIAMKRLNGIIIQPGETFSYWKLIGNPNRRKGYVEGMVLFYGGFKPGIGGGLCQLSNLLYWITLHTPLQITERHRHSYDVFPDSGRSQPFGSGATCAYNYLDLRITNPTDRPYQLTLQITDEFLIGSWNSVVPQELTYEVYEKEHRITQEHWGGHMRHNLLYRRVWNQQEELIDDQYITENHALMMYQPFLKSENEVNEQQEQA